MNRHCVRFVELHTLYVALEEPPKFNANDPSPFVPVIQEPFVNCGTSGRLMFTVTCAGTDPLNPLFAVKLNTAYGLPVSLVPGIKITRPPASLTSVLAVFIAFPRVPPEYW